MIPRYDCPEIRNIWEEQNKYLLWTRIELLFLWHLREIDVPVPESFSPEWIKEIQEIEATTKHDLAAFVYWLEKYLAVKIGAESRFVHYGLTSSDIVDTAFSLMIKQTDNVINKLVKNTLVALDVLINKYEHLEMLGRTHGQAAEKILLADKLSSYSSALANFSPKERYFGRLAGSVGDYKYFKKTMAQSTLLDLGLEPCNVNDGQIIHRALYAKYMNNWALLGGVVGKIATDIRLLSQSGINEMREGFAEGQMGSSSMPQKRNPILCENLCGLARILRGYQTTIMQDIELWNERDISHSSAERIVFPDAAVILGFMLIRLASILENLDINKVSMSYNLHYFESDIAGQERMLRLIDSGMSRSEAHKAIKKELIK